MFNEIVKRVRKSQLILMTVFVIIAILLMAITKFNIIKLINGPTNIDPFKDELTNYAGQYVQADIYHPLVIYEEYFARNNKTNQESITHYSYIIMEPDETYNNYIFYGVKIPLKHRSTFNNLIAESDKFVSSNEKLPVYEPFTAKGTVKKMDYMQLEYFNKFLTEAGQQPLYEAYYIDHDTLPGNMSVSKVLGYNIAAGICILIAIIMLILSLSNLGLNSIRKYVTKHPETTLDMLDYEFRKAQRFTKNVWVSTGYVFASSPTSIRVLDLSDIVWAHYYKTNGRYKQSCVFMYDTDKKKHSINATEKEADAILEYLEEIAPHTVVAYSKSLENMFHNNFNEFLKRQYLKPVEETDDFFNNI